jgi:hypothetical protein
MSSVAGDSSVPGQCLERVLLRVPLGGFSVLLKDALVVPSLATYDIVLGKPFFRQMGERMKINYITHRVTVGKASWIAQLRGVEGAQWQSRDAAVHSEPGDAAPIMSGEEVGLFLLTARQASRALRKPGMVEKMGWLFPRLVPGAGKGASLTDAWEIGGVVADDRAGEPEVSSEFAGVSARGGVGKPSVKGVLQRGVRFGNDGKQLPTQAMRSLLEEFEAVLPEELPFQLPPDRGAPMRIDTIPGAATH